MFDNLPALMLGALISVGALVVAPLVFAALVLVLGLIGAVGAAFGVGDVRRNGRQG